MLFFFLLSRYTNDIFISFLVICLSIFSPFLYRSFTDRGLWLTIMRVYDSFNVNVVIFMDRIRF